MEGSHDLPAEAVDAARRIVQESNRSRRELVETVCAEGFDRETARRAVQRLALDDRTTLTPGDVQSR